MRRSNCSISDGAVVLGLVYGYLPFMVLPFVCGRRATGPGAGGSGLGSLRFPWSVFRRVVLPLTKPGVIAGCLLVFIPSLGAFITPDLLGGARSMMVGNLIQHEYLVVRDWPQGSALSFVLMGFLIVAMAVYYRVDAGMDRQGRPTVIRRRVWLQGDESRQRAFSVSPDRRVGPVLVQCLPSLGDLAGVHAEMVCRARRGPGAARGDMEQSAGRGRFHGPCDRGSGVAVALGLERLGFRSRRVIEGAMLLPLVVPEIMMGVALMLFFVLVRLPLGLPTVIIAHNRLQSAPWSW
ncbi:MAG: hypothetical protein KatS3mg082_0279 [Nitrospiraceae bacterium]|nr:MAG: hypothetical protein KatS3mg082_0279 [Nitrospiraceae bacterium]